MTRIIFPDATSVTLPLSPWRYRLIRALYHATYAPQERSWLTAQRFIRRRLWWLCGGLGLHERVYLARAIGGDVGVG